MSDFLSFIFASGSPTGRWVVRIILILFGIGLFDSLIQLLYYIRREKKALEKAKAYINQQMSIEHPDKLEESLREAGVWTKSLAYQRIQHLFQIKARNGTIDSDALAEIALGRQSLWGGLGRHFTSILVLIGLFGTVLGLSRTIIEIQPLIADIEHLDDPTRIGSIIGGTLSGMKTAFSTTLMGLLGSLILGLFGFWVNRVGAKFSIELEEFTTTILLPIFNPSPFDQLRQTTEHLTGSANAMESAMDESMRAMQQAARQLADSPWEVPLAQQYLLTEKFRDFSVDFKKSLGRISEFQHIIDSALGSFQTAITQLSNKQDQLMEILQSSLPSLKQESGNISEMISRYQNSQSDFITDLHNAFKTTQAHFLDQLTNRLQESDSIISELIKQQQQGSEHLRDFVDTIYKKSSASNKQLSDTLNQSMKDMQFMISQFQENNNSMIEELVRQQQGSEDLRKTLSASNKRLSDAFNQSMKEIQSMVFQFIDQQQEISVTLEKLGAQLQIKETLEQQNHLLRELIRPFGESETIAASIQNLIQENQKQGNELISVMRESMNRTEEIDLLRQLSASMMEMTVKMKSRWSLRATIWRFFRFGKKQAEGVKEKKDGSTSLQ